MANELDLLAVDVAHQLDLIRVANGLGALSTPHLNAITKQVRRVLSKYDTIDTIKLRDQIIKEISELTVKELSKFVVEVERDLNLIIKEEIRFQFGNVKAIAGSISSRPTFDAVMKTIHQKPMVLNGKAVTWTEYLKDYTPSQVSAITRVIKAGWADGLTTAQISRNITGTKSQRGVIQTSQSSAFRMTKDLTSHQSSQTKATTGKENDGIIVGEKVVVTLDSKTSPICQDLGSQDNGGAEFFYKTDGHNFPRNPFHPNCRSTMSYILAKEYRDVIDIGTRPAVVNGKAIQVPADTNWIDIAKKYPQVAEASLGPTRAKLLNNMSSTEFTNAAYNRMNQPITIDQMVDNNKKVASILQ